MDRSTRGEQSKTSYRCVQPRRARIGTVRALLFYSAAGVGCLLLGSPAEAQVTPTTADFVEWDLPSFEGAGTCPSAIGAITLRPPTGEPIDPVYYVTRCDAPSLVDPSRIGPSIVQFMPGDEGTFIGPLATWTAWNLGFIPSSGVGNDFGPTGGMRLSSTGRVFVRGATQLLRLNLIPNGDGTSTLTRWNDVVINTDPNSVSDLAIVERNSGTLIDVWTTHDAILTGTPDDPLTPIDPLMPPGVVQRLSIANTSNGATITRWAVDGGAGNTYLGGIAIFQGKVYFSESSSITIDGRGNAIGVLDPTTHSVKHFSLDPVLASGPRQLSVDTAGIVWTITESGHVVSLNPATNRMAAYIIPGFGGVMSPGAMADPRGISPSGGMVGFSESQGKKVGLLLPNDPGIEVVYFEETVPRVTTTLDGTTEAVMPDVGTVEPQFKPNSPAFHTDIDPFGEFIEADLPDIGDFPLGILRDPFSTPGTFWIAVQVGPTLHRLSRVTYDLNGAAPALVTGGGTIDATTTVDPALDPDPDSWASDGGKANFGFNVYRKSTGAAPRGHLNYLNKVTGEHVKSVEILTFEVTGNSARFTGTCTNNGMPCTFDVTVLDNGNPGRGKDTFQITGVGVVPNGDTLNGGNIKIHKQ